MQKLNKPNPSMSKPLNFSNNKSNFFIKLRQTIKAKDQYILDLKEKYKAKKNQINKEINKLKNFWQSTS